ncbi:hypothetical protein V6N13_117987 [Hibiscus sabdariffa]
MAGPFSANPIGTRSCRGGSVEDASTLIPGTGLPDNLPAHHQSKSFFCMEMADQANMGDSSCSSNANQFLSLTMKLKQPEERFVNNYTTGNDGYLTQKSMRIVS